MNGLKRVVAYLVILIIVGLVFSWVFIKLSSEPILDNSQQLQELGLTETGNEFINIKRPTYNQIVRSPLTVRFLLHNLSGVNVYLRDQQGNILGQQQVQAAVDNSEQLINISFVQTQGSGWLDIEPLEEGKEGVRLQIRYSE